MLSIMSSSAPIRWMAVLVAGFGLTQAYAQERIYRCPGTPVEYINNADQARSRGCTLMQGGNITVIEGIKPQGGSGASRPAASSAPVKWTGTGSCPPCCRWCEPRVS